MPDPLPNKGPAVLLRVEDSSWQGVVRLRRDVTESLQGAASRVRVDLRRLDPHAASAFWLAALVSLRRVASAQGCSLVLVAPPASLVAALARLHLEVDQRPGSWCDDGDDVDREV